MTLTVIDEAIAGITERCDRCSAQARVRADLVNGSLFFCGHHARQLSGSLKEKSLSLYDPEGLIKNVNI